MPNFQLQKFENLSFKLEGVWKKMNEMFVFYEQVVSSYEKKKNNFKGTFKNILFAFI